MKMFKKFIRQFESTSVAVALAEGGEPEMALAILKESENQVFKGSRGGEPIGQILTSPSVSK